MNALTSEFSLALKWVLQKVFRFDSWHVTTLRKRPYALNIIRHGNRKEIRNSVVEIGCGLGDIIRNLDYRHRTGFDSDRRVLRAASILGGPFSANLHWTLFTFPDTPLPGKFDLIIMVNWIHHLEPYVLKSKLADYFHAHLHTNGEIIVDTVQDPDYKYNHDIHFLSEDLGATVLALGKHDRQRELWALIKTS